MPLELYEIVQSGQGFLAIMAAPRVKSLDKDIRSLRERRVDIAVSLLLDLDVEYLGLGEEEAKCARHGIGFISFPIMDHSVPNDVEAFRALAERLQIAVDNNIGVAAHCRAGIGRSGLLAASVLLRYGYSPRDACAHVSRQRGFAVPENVDQTRWFHENAERLAGG